MHLVHEHGFRDRIRIGPTRHPRRVGPRIHPSSLDNRRVARRLLELESQRIGLHARGATWRPNFELVQRARRHAWYEQLEDPAAAHRAHHVRAAIPVVEISNHRNATRIRCPHRERRAVYPIDDTRVRTEFVPQPQVTTFAMQMQIDRTKCRQEPIRIVERTLPTID